jgi:hypothetical protein
VSAAANPNYDLPGAIETLAPGVVVQREMVDAVDIAYAANGYQALTSAQVIAALQTPPPSDTVKTLANAPTLPVVFPVQPPPYPTGLPRFADSNPATDGWCIDAPSGAGSI